MPYRAYEVKTPFLAPFGRGGLDKRKFCRSGIWKTHFGMSQHMMNEN